MDYAAVWRQSLKTLWQQKILWALGIVLMFFGQGEYTVNLSWQDLLRYAPLNRPGNFGSEWLEPLTERIIQWVSALLEALIRNPLPYVLGAAAVVFLIWGVQTFACAWARGALIGAVNAAQPDPLEPGWLAGARRTPTLFLLAAALQIPLWLLTLPAVLAAIFWLLQLAAIDTPGQGVDAMLASSLGLLVCATPLACVGGLLGGLQNLANAIAARACVCESLGFIASLKRAWQVFTWKPGYILLTGVIFWLAGVVFGFLGAIPFYGLWFPLAGDLIRQSLRLESYTTLAALVGYWLVASVLVGSALTTYNQIFWTHLYQQFLLDERSLPTAQEFMPELPQGREII